MGGCSVIGCKSRTEKAKNSVTFHSFPTDHYLKKDWIKATGRKDWEPIRSSKICSKHFDDDAISFVNKIRRINPEAVPVKNVHTPVVSSKKIKRVVVNPFALPSTSLEYTRNQNQPKSKRKQTLSQKNTQKSLPKKSITPRQEKLLKLKVQKAKQLSLERLRKLRALREVNRRLRKKNAKLQTTLTELQCQMNLNAEEIAMLGVDDTNSGFYFITCE